LRYWDGTQWSPWVADDEGALHDDADVSLYPAPQSETARPVPPRVEQPARKSAPWGVIGFSVSVIAFVVAFFAFVVALVPSGEVSFAERNSALVVFLVALGVFVCGTAFGAFVTLIRGAQDIAEHQQWAWPRLLAGLAGVVVLGFTVWAIVEWS
jgi:hypothetical protein